ncbi:MAG TPA: ABC transporter permease [Candidatus Acidoferrales bacterium]|nr:ABC transporter permease [Candidatus Acidoferrales bacterium]
MNFGRIFAIIERDMRKFLRSPSLMMTSMVFPLLQLIVLGYAFGGEIKNVRLALVDNDHGAESRLVREKLNAIAQGPKTFRIEEYGSLSDAMTDLKAGFIKAIVYVPPDFSSKVMRDENPRMAFIEDNTDTLAMSGIAQRMQQVQADLNGPTMAPMIAGEAGGSNSSRMFTPQRLPPQISIQTVEVYPYIEYIKYLLAGSISISIFVVAMIGGGIVFIDDKARGLHEGYLVTPVSKADLILGLVFAGAIKGVMAGLTITIIGGLIAGIERLWDPVRLVYLVVVLTVTALAMISFMFLLMVRVDDPLVPRAIFGVLNTLLYFPSGAIYPTEGFPAWLRWISVVDPFTYAVHALKNLLLKNTGLSGIYGDIGVLAGFAIVFISLSIFFFQRQI